MKNKFIRTLSPITAVVIGVLDIAVAVFAVLSVTFFKTAGGARPYIFFALEIFAIIVAILVTKEVLLGGIVFRDDELEFNMIDEDNVFLYDDISKVEIYKDNSASLTKNFNDRHALITIETKDGNTHPLDAGLIDVKKVKSIKNELENHIDKNIIELRIINKLNLLDKDSNKD